MPAKPLTINSKELHLMKPVTDADYSSKTVLTNSAWEYAELWLRRRHSASAKKALFYWRQARNFYVAAEVLPIESRPLCSYYCCLNSAKALLAIKGDPSINFDQLAHGITSDRRQWKGTNILNAEVIFNGGGVLFELSKLLEEEHCKKTYSVYDLMYNIPCIHRSFSITYNCPELFIPVSQLGFVVDTDIKKGWLQFKVDERYANGTALKYKPSQYEKLPESNGSKCYLMRGKKRFKWDIHEDLKTREKNLSSYHKKMRKDFHYICGNVNLWYLKKEIPTSGHVLQRNSLTLIFAVMHWLSELVRYNPEQFEKLMLTRQNWVIHEFVENALRQFTDEISCEMTGTDIMSTSFRKPK